MHDKHLDCCPAPALKTIKSLYSKSHDDEELRRCGTCGANWFWRFHELMNFDDGDDEITEWFTRLTEEEAATIAAAQGRPDLTFLRHRPAIQFDQAGVTRVHGQPAVPFA